MTDPVSNVATAPLSIVDKLRMLLDITKKISRSLDLDEILNLVMDTLDSLLPYDAAGIYLLKCDEITADSDPNKQPCVFETATVRGYDLDDLVKLRLGTGEGIIGHVAQTGKTYMAKDVRTVKRYVNARKETLSELVAPVISNDEVIGVFDLESDRVDAYTDDDVQVLQLLASQVAIIIEKVRLHEHLVEKQRLEGQLEVARQVQLDLLPAHDPKLPGFDISAYNFPTEEVSGDYYDWVRIYDDQIGLVLADVSGKGVPAALLMAFLRASLRAAFHIGYAPHISMAKVNNLLWESTETHQFVTAFYGTLDATSRTLAFTNAGHNPPLLLETDGTIRFLDKGGLPLGMFFDTRYHEYYLTLEPGQILVLYTDGLTEATDPLGIEYGLDRLSAQVLKGRDGTARALIESIRQDVMVYTDGRGSDDDVTLFVIKSTGKAELPAGTLKVKGAIDLEGRPRLSVV
jgi:sigma-B regulation protein RsbU (phosphoserine phosphatase)